MTEISIDKSPGQCSHTATCKIANTFPCSCYFH